MQQLLVNMNAKTLTKMLCISFVIVGLLGFIPAASPGGLLFGIFQVDFVHSTTHLLIGLFALLTWKNLINQKIFYRVIGIFFAVMTVLGLLSGNSLMILLPVNLADCIVNALLSLLALWLGFATELEKK